MAGWAPFASIRAMKRARQVLNLLLLAILLWFAFHLIPPVGYKPIYLGSEEHSSISGVPGCRPYSVAVSRRSDNFERLDELTAYGTFRSEGVRLVLVLETETELDVKIGSEALIHKNFGLSQQTVTIQRTSIVEGLYFKKLEYVIHIAERTWTGVQVDLPTIQIDDETWNLDTIVVRPARNYFEVFITSFAINC